MLCDGCVPGADVNLVDTESGFSALHHACRAGHIEVAKLLLDSGVMWNVFMQLAFFVEADHNCMFSICGVWYGLYDGLFWGYSVYWCPTVLRYFSN